MYLNRCESKCIRIYFYIFLLAFLNYNEAINAEAINIQQKAEKDSIRSHKSVEPGAETQFGDIVPSIKYHAKQQREKSVNENDARFLKKLVSAQGHFEANTDPTPPLPTKQIRSAQVPFTPQNDPPTPLPTKQMRSAQVPIMAQNDPPTPLPTKQMRSAQVPIMAQNDPPTPLPTKQMRSAQVPIMAQNDPPTPLPTKQMRSAQVHFEPRTDPPPPLPTKQIRSMRGNFEKRANSPIQFTTKKIQTKNSKNGYKSWDSNQIVQGIYPNFQAKRELEGQTSSNNIDASLKLNAEGQDLNYRVLSHLRQSAGEQLKSKLNNKYILSKRKAVSRDHIHPILSHPDRSAKAGHDRIHQIQSEPKHVVKVKSHVENGEHSKVPNFLFRGENYLPVAKAFGKLTKNRAKANEYLKSQPRPKINHPAKRAAGRGKIPRMKIKKNLGAKQALSQLLHAYIPKEYLEPSRPNSPTGSLELTYKNEKLNLKSQIPPPIIIPSHEHPLIESPNPSNDVSWDWDLHDDTESDFEHPWYPSRPAGTTHRPTLDWNHRDPINGPGTSKPSMCHSLAEKKFHKLLQHWAIIICPPHQQYLTTTNIPTEESWYGNETEEPWYWNQTEKRWFWNQTEKPQNWNQTEETWYGNQTEKPLYWNQTEEPWYGNQTVKPLYWNQTEEPWYGNQTEKPWYRNQTEERWYWDSNETTTTFDSLGYLDDETSTQFGTDETWDGVETSVSPDEEATT
ncbi:hypothetical protein V9T40_002618 [Parthenolecanium corni]|uniref:Uncharacterized protein n=1 Tax=Parthenolecanium corni TaxID=536013 RepID=A0AAN9TH19_9HEMI